MLRGPWRTDTVQGEGWRVQPAPCSGSHPVGSCTEGSTGSGPPLLSASWSSAAAGVESEQELGGPGPRAFEEGPLQRSQHPLCTVAGSQHAGPGLWERAARAPPAFLGLRRARSPCPLPVSIQSPVRAPRLQQAPL